MTQPELFQTTADEPVEEKEEQIQCRQCGKWVPEENAEEGIYCHACYHRLLAESQDEMHFKELIEGALIRQILTRVRAKALFTKERWRRHQLFEEAKQHFADECKSVEISVEKMLGY